VAKAACADAVNDEVKEDSDDANPSPDPMPPWPPDHVYQVKPCRATSGAFNAIALVTAAAAPSGIA
jgi:hypothetical protein